jgi:hypothetical protein
LAPVLRRVRRQGIQKDEVAKMNLTKIGSITTSRTTSPMDAKRDLSKKRMSWAANILW